MDIQHVLNADISTRSVVESMIREDATIATGELYDVANILGMSDQQVRLCIKRLVAEGRFTQEGRGRKAILHATGATRNTLEPDLDFVRYMYQQDRGLAPWDGGWHLTAFAVPESARTARDAMREEIVRLGGAPIQGGLYVCANAWESRVGAAAERFGVAEHVTMFTTTDLAIGGETGARELAERLWPIDAIAERHRRLLAVAEGLLPVLRTASPTELLTLAVALAAEFTRAVEPDPLLPPQLLPQPWVGAAARSAAAACWAELAKTEADQSIRLFGWYREAIQQII
ncbi:PaaX family transcriptional regulator C-terminal domain-containing protein [Mycobacteroides abscessus]|uniref:PaaX-like C-terminal domain protein n=1 Tax=Mycobacteroides abscessus 21 TaxID=1299324 RepID=A0A829PWY9_9MYCO|nr:PaaX family transcriptional regulator C-terminal domain-containing protein [Mycobacteroides abscessus]ETZ93118.1 paaX-like C-terminal domain protein [Mycobacteroides abscessus MAB_030201_1061]EUA45136.1 paaX-like C-terminal domain protein [Mycobacteroides abscessus 21]MBN7327459.1 transcriptional regulator [Mycobacteroides abscessus subsp. abscessus]MBN7330511.1 transcriptional regulator [Mycobacteroides abscessus subsp. abscessus]MBN7385276.1 transcriptional regulator [Mycobacteroides absc